MHGQKGVVGFLESQENFPFTSAGIVPDIVINPHAFPTRQTPGQLLEAALGKGIACGGKITYATPFTTPSVDVITEQLHRYNFTHETQISMSILTAINLLLKFMLLLEDINFSLPVINWSPLWCMVKKAS